MKIGKILLTCIFTGLFVSACVKSNPPDTTPAYLIFINNKTSNDLQVFYQLNYPDTSLQENRPITTNLSANTLGFIPSEKKWDEIINQNSHHYISFFFMASGTLVKYSWDTVRSQYIILKRMEFHLDSLRKQNWTIQYPD
jgi:hypothetical protein